MLSETSNDRRRVRPFREMDFFILLALPSKNATSLILCDLDLSTNENAAYFRSHKTGKIGECGYTICFVRTSDSIFVNRNKALN